MQIIKNVKEGQTFYCNNKDNTNDIKFGGFEI